MKIVLAGGSGQVGAILRRHFSRDKAIQVLNLSRSGEKGWIKWDGRTLGNWAEAIDGADLVVNLAGRSVDCRYTKTNLKEMMDSRVESTRVIGQTIEGASRPPALWLQMSTATIYSHRFDQANDEDTGIIGGQELDAPSYWGYSIEIAKAWERELSEAKTPKTRKVALRAAMVMSPGRGGVFDVLYKMTMLGLGGPIGGGHQYVSWIHDLDFCRAIDFLIRHDEIDGPVNLCAPGPLPQKEFMGKLRLALGIPIGFPATKWMAELGALVLRTDTELLLKSRRVVPTRLLKSGFEFQFPDWETAAKDLSYRRRHG
ncbi:MAG: TIGR01777 family protein [Bdellovibrionaceae bacterium]|nr:TIGR01777 family oxidoreductase [Bdellovibrionales bacterium]MCB9085147.1 TIGR01777 family protein [Pseudobdellovibrionaceae bacterium]